MLSEEERATLEQMADAAGVNTSDFVRSWVHRHGFEVQIEREWAALRSIHRQVINGEKINSKLLQELSKNQIFELANRILDREPAVSDAWLAYSAAFVVADTTEKSLSSRFYALSTSIDKWMKRIRERSLDAMKPIPRGTK
jgi:hypothetical protein